MKRAVRAPKKMPVFDAWTQGQKRKTKMKTERKRVPSNIINHFALILIK